MITGAAYEDVTAISTYEFIPTTMCGVTYTGACRGTNGDDDDDAANHTGNLDAEDV